MSQYIFYFYYKVNNNNNNNKSQATCRFDILNFSIKMIDLTNKTKETESILRQSHDGPRKGSLTFVSKKISIDLKEREPN